MRRLSNGLIILDALDIMCLSFSAGSSIGCLVKIYKKCKNRKGRRSKDPIITELEGKDPLVTELEEKSPVITFSGKDKPLKLPLVRGGDNIKGFSLAIKNKKLARLVWAIAHANKKQRQLRFLRILFFAFNGLLTSTVGFRFAVGGSIEYTQFILIAFPSTLAGLMMTVATAYPVATLLLPLAILHGRDIKDVVEDPSEKCRIICKFAADFYNKQMIMEMKSANSLIEDVSTALRLPLDKVPWLCVENKLSLLERFKLRKLLSSDKAQKQVQYYREFIKKFPDCDVHIEAVYEQIVGKVAE